MLLPASSFIYSQLNLTPFLCRREDEHRSVQKQHTPKEPEQETLKEPQQPQEQQQQQQIPPPPPPPEPAPVAPQATAPSTLESPYNGTNWSHSSQDYPGYHWMSVPDNFYQQQRQQAQPLSSGVPGGPRAGGYYPYNGPPPPWGGPPSHVPTPPVQKNPDSSQQVPPPPPPAPQQAATGTSIVSIQPFFSILGPTTTLILSVDSIDLTFLSS